MRRLMHMEQRVCPQCGSSLGTWLTESNSSWQFKQFINLVVIYTLQIIILAVSLIYSLFTRPPSASFGLTPTLVWVFRVGRRICRGLEWWSTRKGRNWLPGGRWRDSAGCTRLWSEVGWARRTGCYRWIASVLWRGCYRNYCRCSCLLIASPCRCSNWAA